ncbi:DNA/RNA non-specific endonuclease [Arthrobacter sp. Rue61a]|uniref:DNA/RNA non-specific endonuclease n=1 Tax=Arthrobacter sp. Rue61a TaxID=1118963 RepID=UPI00027DF5FD|nr:DNA/RNA non-specific endonuclease [Arthrobacter sp. Rue61a]AFR30456.1 hypothetical protein ARUE_c35760 [Arthrobacter sp. Rue61a]
MSADFADVCAAGPGASGISVDGLPPLPDPDALETHARALAVSGNDVYSGVNDAARTWAGLSGAYEAPEAGQVLAGFNPVFARSQDLANLTSNAASVLAAYADRARELKQRINTLRADVRALDEVIGGNDDWHAQRTIVDRHRETMDKASALAQAILDSDATCATELSGLTGGQRYSAPAIPRATLNGKRMPNVTYNVVAKTDGGLENHFTIITDDFAKPKSVEAHITGLLKGDINRSAWQQILAGRRVGGFGYDGGHLIASLFAGPGEGANLLAQLMFQNRGHGTPNVSANTLAFFQLERDLMTKALHRVDTGQPLDLHLKVEAVPRPKPGLPEELKVTHWFDSGEKSSEYFSNLALSEEAFE